MSVTLIAAPPGFRDLLGVLPSATTLSTRLTPMTQLALCFVCTFSELSPVFDLLTAQLPEKASAWIIYPKSSLKPGFNERQVRETGLAAGFVDYKVCSVSEAWSALKFTRRKISKPGAANPRVGSRVPGRHTAPA